MRLDGKVILVTGGTSGLGRATSLALAAAGARVVFTGRNQSGAKQTLARLEDFQGQARFLAQDVTLEADWSRVIDAVLTEEGQLHGLVNNAGVSRLKPMDALSISDIEFLLKVNVEGMFLGIKHAMNPIAAAGGGAIVNISALNALRGSPNATGYCLAKAGTTHLARAAALEGLETGVRVSAVHPGVLFEESDRPSPGAIALFGEEGARRFVQHQTETTPLGRLGHPRDIGAAVVFLMSDQARHVTGATVVVDGGRMAGEFQHHGVASQQ
jgi:NAD(P)-dependent dehydrogenase (short-subunit alcohol dehydrogenase family)